MKPFKKIRYTKVSSIYIKDSKPISSVLIQSLQDTNLEKRLLQRSLSQFWKEMFGISIVNATQGISLQKHTLTIQLQSSVIKTELLMLKTSILKKFQDKFGKENIRYLIIY